MKYFCIILSIRIHRFIAKDLNRDTQAKNKQTVNNVHDGLIDLRYDINRIEIPENGNPKKAVEIVEKFLDFNKQRKSKGIKILTPKQILQRLPIALAQVKPGNTSENLLNEIRQIKKKKKNVLCIKKKK